MIDPPPGIALVCGSRSLAGDPAAEAWARHMIHCISDHADVIVAGDAEGPDKWAADRVFRLRSEHLRGRFYDLDGVVYDAAGTPLGRWCRAERVPRGPDDPHWHRWPLARNEAMVRAVALRARREGRLAAVYALVDPRSPTQGAMHTVTLARRAGLVAHVERYDAAAWRAQAGA